MNKNYNTRVFVVFIIFFLVYASIATNLFVVQIIKKEFYCNLGKKQYNVSITMRPSRAPILDRTGKNFFAMNKEYLSAFILPKQLTKEKTAIIKKFLNNNFPDAIERLEKSKKSHFMFIKRKLSNAQIEVIKNSNIEDLYLLKEEGRFYPIESASTVIGLTDIDNNGLSGIEIKFNSNLSGQPSTFYLEKDARFGHFFFKREEKIKGREPKAVTLTLSSDLQFLAAEELLEIMEKNNAKSGAIIVMDPKTGEIHALVNYPYFDPNEPKTITPENSKNKIITECYELGSVMKIPAAIAALEEKVVTPDELIDCKNTRSTYIDGRKINTVHEHGVITFSEIIQHSNNIGIAIVAKRVGEKIYNHYARMGFGKKTGIEFPGEQSGFINPPSNWSKQSIISLSYGYEVTETLLQIANLFCLIANDGIPVKPKLILPEKATEQATQRSLNANFGSSASKSPNADQHDCANQKETISQEENLQADRLYSKETMTAIKTILENTTQKGTCRRARINGYKTMCKTGTANLLVNGQYSKNDNIFTCAGIVEKDDYQRVIVVFVKEIDKKRVHADTVAAPLFEKIASKTLIHDKII